jgi:lysophospholipase L1-like esterase
VERANRGDGPLTVVCIGDSNTEIVGYAGALRLLLQGCYGDGGTGYQTFGKRMEELSFAPVIRREGAWTDFDFAIDPSQPPAPRPWLAPDGLWAATESNGAAMSVKCAFPAHIRLYYQVGPGLGSFAVTGVASAKELKADCQAEKSGISRIEFDATTFTVRHAAGRIVLFGFDAQRQGLRGGAVVHQLGNAFGMAHQFAAMEEETYARFLGDTRPDLITILLGTNDMNNGWKADEYREQLEILVGKIRRAAPGASVLIMSAPSCAFDRMEFAKAFDAAAHAVAAEHDCLFWSLCDFVGDSWKYWDALGLMEYTLHYRPPSGMRVALELLRQVGFDLYDSRNTPAVREPALLLPPGAVPRARLPKEGWPQRPDRQAKE